MLKVDDIIAELKTYGFKMQTENSKTIGYSDGEQTVYIKKESKRQPLVLHPDNQSRFTVLSTIAGVLAENPLRFYHNATMRAFPERLNTGDEPTKYGLAFGFNNTPAFQAFMSNFLSDGPSPLAADLINIALGAGSPTEREYLLKARIGQGIFRDGLMEEFNGKCPVTNISRPELLRASHIKPFRRRPPAAGPAPRHGRGSTRKNPALRPRALRGQPSLRRGRWPRHGPPRHKHPPRHADHDPQPAVPAAGSPRLSAARRFRRHR